MAALVILRCVQVICNQKFTLSILETNSNATKETKNKSGEDIFEKTK